MVIATANDKIGVEHDTANEVLMCPLLDETPGLRDAPACLTNRSSCGTGSGGLVHLGRGGPAAARGDVNQTKVFVGGAG